MSSSELCPGATYVQIQISRSIRIRNTCFPVSDKSTYDTADSSSSIFICLKSSDRSQVIHIGNRSLACICPTGNTARLYPSRTVFFVCDCDISCIERIIDRSLRKPSGNTTYDVITIVDGPGVVSLLHRAGETSHDAAYMAGIVFVLFIANLALVVHIIEQSRSSGPFCRITHNAAHVDGLIRRSI